MPSSWQRQPTVFERTDSVGVRSLAIGPERYRASGFTGAVLRGADYRAGRSIADRLAEASAALAGSSALIYVYVPELDVVAHSSGLASARWLAALEELDAAVAGFTSTLGAAQGLLVTADHGVVDVPREAQRVIPAELLAGVRHVAGEPRGLQLHLEVGESPEQHAQRWREQEGARAWIATRDEAVAAGWFGQVDAEVLPRIGDVLIAARKQVAYYADADDRGRSMVGQHGSLSPDELTIPLLRFGAFARR